MSISTWEEYQSLTPEQKEREQFCLMRNTYTEVIETKEHVKKTNGRVRSLELWRNLIIGGLIVISAVLVPIFLDLIKLHA